MTATDATPSAASPAGGTLSLYDEISLDRDESTAVIREKLHNLKLGWGAKAARAGSLGETARNQLALIAQAEEVFRDDDTREQYDLTLVRRAAPVQTDDSKIDWLSRAWAYYFTRDDGAAAVSARKAREQDPNDAMVYVVSAWIKIWQDELKQAKQDADEAFVLDELGEDTADVHHVRGVVFLLLTDYDKAIQSFDRAIAKASDGERPEILWRKALAYEGKRDGMSMFDCCLQALTSGQDITELLAGDVKATTNRAVVRVCEQSDPTASARNYRDIRGRVEKADMPAKTKADLLGFVDACVSLKELEARRDSLGKIEDAKGVQAGIPLMAIGIAVLFLFITFAWVPAIVVVLVAGGWAAYKLSQRSQWSNARNAFQSAQRELAELQNSISSGQQKIGRLQVAPALTRG